MDMHWKKECKRILDQMYNKDKGNMKRGGYQTPDSVFQQPVDTTKVYDYLHYVKHPMDLGTIRQALERGDIASPDDFIALVRSFLIRPKTVTFMYTQRKNTICSIGAVQVRFTFRNAHLYNPENTSLWKLASDCSNLFEQWVARQHGAIG